MTKHTISVLALALLVAASGEAACASSLQKGKVSKSAAVRIERVRNANAYAGPFKRTFDEAPSIRNEALSAPAGH